ncbi:MAG: hypothetical protein KAJ29_05790 [Alphaproteobacteria bacterium]|nr:hypothetical protein [Alphaproteobacteria bacterium]
MPLIEQKRFIGYELGLLTIKAALSTRDKNNTIYKSSVKEHQKKPAKNAIRDVLTEIEVKYETMLSEKQHVQYISDTATNLTNKIGQYLRNDEFRIGIAQKLINLHLKYLWCSNVISEPPHCPIDGIIRDKVKVEYPEFNYDWISSNSIDEYRLAAAILRQQAESKKQTVAQWELREFRRRDDF